MTGTAIPNPGVLFPWTMGPLLAALSAVVYGCADYCGGSATRRLPAATVTVMSQLAGLLTVLILLPIVPGTPSMTDIALGAVGGLAGGTGIMLLYRSLALGAMSVVSPVTAVCAALVPAGIGLAAGERPGAVALTGIGLAIAAIVLVSVVPAPAASDRPTLPIRRVLAGALGAGTGFGLFFVLLAWTGDDAGLWPLLGARPVSIALAATVARRMAAPLRIPRRDWPVVAAAGVLDMGANALYLLATAGEQLAVVAVLASLYPASTVALARLLGAERLRPIQWSGLMCAGGALVLLALR
ncbi:MAG: EamA family transporter [Acidimicrobiales bacterium]